MVAGKAFSPVHRAPALGTLPLDSELTMVVHVFLRSDFSWCNRGYMINSKHMLHRNAESYRICTSFTKQTEELSFSSETPMTLQGGGARF